MNSGGGGGLNHFPLLFCKSVYLFDILITLYVKCLYMNYDNLFMFQSHPRSLKQMFRIGSETNE